MEREPIIYVSLIFVWLQVLFSMSAILVSLICLQHSQAASDCCKKHLNYYSHNKHLCLTVEGPAAAVGCEQHEEASGAPRASPAAPQCPRGPRGCAGTSQGRSGATEEEQDTEDTVASLALGRGC